MNTREMRALLNMSRVDFAREYSIPVRTLEDWEAGVRHPPDYVLELLERCVAEDVKKLMNAPLSEGREDVSVENKGKPVNAEAVEKLLLTGSGDRFGIYQIREGSPSARFMYLNMENVKKLGGCIENSDYKLVYVSNLSSTDLSRNEELEMIFERFNVNRPDDFYGHSLSVSDIVVINRWGKPKAYYVDSFGFKDLPDFAMERKAMLGLTDVRDGVLTGTEEVSQNENNRGSVVTEEPARVKRKGR